MKILVVGAGGIGGYFGGRLLEAGRDVTFLVRPRRAAQLAEHGLVIRSPHGDIHHAQPATVLADALHGPFELVLLSCKAFDLDDAMESFAPAVGPNTAILPLLNGMKHVEALSARFGPAAVLGGLAMISATLAPDGEVQHLNQLHAITFGECDGTTSDRVTAIGREFAAAHFTSRLSAAILQEMWEKWVFIATGAGITSLMRAPVGDIVAAGGAPLVHALLTDCARIATGAGFRPSDASLQRSLDTFTAAGSPLTASMYRDIEGGGRTEAEHVLGDLLRRGSHADDETSVLRIAYVHVAAYEAGRRRNASESSPAT